MSDDKTVLSMCGAAHNGVLRTPEDALKDALHMIDSKGAFKSGKKLLIIALDEGENKTQYNISWVQAGMTMSECLTICEVSKALFLTEMEILAGGCN